MHMKLVLLVLTVTFVFFDFTVLCDCHSSGLTCERVFFALKYILARQFHAPTNSPYADLGGPDIVLTIHA